MTITHMHIQDMDFSCHIACVMPLLNSGRRVERLQSVLLEV